MRAYANGLLARDVGKGDAFALLARNSLEWALLDFALARVGAVGVPIYASSSAKDVGYLLAHSEAVGVVCEDEEQLAKVEAVSGELPSLRHVLTFADLPALEAEGREHAEAHPSTLDDTSAAVDEEDLYTIIYTSGTTGPPKGCMLSHRNYYAMASIVDRMETKYYRPDDVMLLYLPLAHNYGRLMLLLGAYVGYSIAFLPDPLRVAEALLQVRPTLLPSVPRVYEKVYAAVQARFAEATGVKRRLVDWALPVGREVSRLEAEGKPVPAGLRAKHALADRLVFAKVRERMGGRLRMPSSGGAPWRRRSPSSSTRSACASPRGTGSPSARPRPPRTVLTPTASERSGNRSPGSRSRSPRTERSSCAARRCSRGTSRTPTRPPGCSPRTAGSGRATSAGSTRTATCGSPTGRRTSSSRPAGRTSRRRTSRTTSRRRSTCPRRSSSATDGPTSPRCSPSTPRRSGAGLAEQGVEGDVATLASDPRVHELLQSTVDDVNRERSRFEQVKRFVVLPRDFGMEHGEVTPTLKLRRRAVIENFQAEIDAAVLVAASPTEGEIAAAPGPSAVAAAACSVLRPS